MRDLLDSLTRGDLGDVWHIEALSVVEDRDALAPRGKVMVGRVERRPHRASGDHNVMTAQQRKPSDVGQRLPVVPRAFDPVNGSSRDNGEPLGKPQRQIIEIAAAVLCHWLELPAAWFAVDDEKIVEVRSTDLIRVQRGVIEKEMLDVAEW